MNPNHDTMTAAAKIAVAWVGLVIGGVTLSHIALVLTIVFTAMQIYKLTREMRRERRLEKLEALLTHADTVAKSAPVPIPVVVVGVEK